MKLFKVIDIYNYKNNYKVCGTCYGIPRKGLQMDLLNVSH